MSQGSHLPLDARIRYELTTRAGDGATAVATARLAHALRAVLDECGVLDSDPDTAQLAEDLRAIIATALRIDS